MSTIAPNLDAVARRRRRSLASVRDAAGTVPYWTRLNAALAVLRVIVGTVFLVHGVEKLFDWGFAEGVRIFAEASVPLASVTAPFATLVELFGGLALILGLFTRLNALALAVTMLGAVLFVHLPDGFFMPNGVEFSLTLLGASVALALAGPGRYSVDSILARRRVRG